MVGTIEHYAFDINHGIASQEALRHGFLDTFVHSRNEILRNSAANHFTLKCVTFTWVRRKTKPTIAKLSRAASLFLMTTLCFCGFLNRLAIRNSNRNKMRFDLRLIF